MIFNKRANLQQSFNQIFDDLNQALVLLPATRPSANLNRPSKTSAYSLLARICLDMRNYPQAETYADQALNLYGTLIDYNTISITSSTPFTTTNDELIYNARQVPVGDFSYAALGSTAKIPLNIINSYSQNDLRLPINYGINSDGSYYKKRGYYGSGNFPFTGLATDELYLIKAECLARRGQTNSAIDELNKLLIKRFKTGTFNPITAINSTVALTIVLNERNKELLWRSLRWFDLKRLNKEGANITLTRVLNGITYTLPPNDDRWAMPIPSDEIALSHIQQNPGR
jgi:tetratricopeptide (TPR) repeat protein